MKPRVLTALNWLNHAVLGLGLCAPCMTITPRMGEHTGLAKWLGLLDEPKTYSIVGGVWKLLQGGNVPIGVILLLFSVCFPIVKLGVLRVALAQERRGPAESPGSALRFVHRFGRYSMVDVLVVALLVVAGQSFPGGTTVDLRWGTYAFAGSVLLATIVAGGLGSKR